jgi:hypothetical protein
MHHQHEGQRGELRDRREVVDRIIGQLLQGRRDRKADRVDEEGVAVRRRLRDDLGADRAAPARAIVDNHGLAPTLAETLRHQPGDVVGGAAGDERNHELDRLSRIVLRRARRARGQTPGENAGEACEQADHPSSPASGCIGKRRCVMRIAAAAAWRLNRAAPFP